MRKQDLYTFLKESGLLDYGSVVTGAQLRELADIEEIEYPAMKADIDRQTLQELAVTDYIRNKLLNEGKYLKGDGESYRVLLPSENAAQVLSYMNSADSKLKRGIKLNNNTPAEYKIPSQDEVRAIMKLESIKKENK